MVQRHSVEAIIRGLNEERVRYLIAGGLLHLKQIAGRAQNLADIQQLQAIHEDAS